MDYKRQVRIVQFVNRVKDDEHFMNDMYARLPSDHIYVRDGYVDQIVGDRHSADAFAFDVLGNMTVLWADGSVRQYIGHEEKQKTGILQ